MMELLAPAGDMEKLETALDFGADAVYLAGDRFGLRTASKNFGTEELTRAVEKTHDRGKEIHITVNIKPHETDLTGLDDYLMLLEKLRVDGAIISDEGVFRRARTVAPKLPIHISTQASATNSETILFWYDLGVKRIVLAREVGLEEIRAIRKKIPRELELEAFGHGAMCISYSGRCLLSNYMAHRDANRGDCAHACRWNYALVEEKRPGEYFPIGEDERGTYILNSKDLMTLPFLDEVVDAGIDSLKIEGRVKTAYYVATVTRAYRLALDAIAAGTFDEKTKSTLIGEIKKASYRDFTDGFYHAKPDEDAQSYASSGYIRAYDFIGRVLRRQGDHIVVEQRSPFAVEEEIEAFGPGKEIVTFAIENLENADGPTERAPHPKEELTMSAPSVVEAGWFLRRRAQS